MHTPRDAGPNGGGLVVRPRSSLRRAAKARQRTQLLAGHIHQAAARRIKVGGGELAVAPPAPFINLSVADETRPFAPIRASWALCLARSRSPPSWPKAHDAGVSPKLKLPGHISRDCCYHPQARGQINRRRLRISLEFFCSPFRGSCSCRHSGRRTRQSDLRDELACGSRAWRVLSGQGRRNL
jgi:hypothetical protein